MDASSVLIVESDGWSGRAGGVFLYAMVHVAADACLEGTRLAMSHFLAFLSISLA